MKRYTIQYALLPGRICRDCPPMFKRAFWLRSKDFKLTRKPPGSKKLQGSDDQFRIRVGKYRVIYEIHEKTVVVLIVRVSHRKDAYR